MEGKGGGQGGRPYERTSPAAVAAWSERAAQAQAPLTVTSTPPKHDRSRASGWHREGPCTHVAALTAGQGVDHEQVGDQGLAARGGSAVHQVVALPAQLQRRRLPGVHGRHLARRIGLQCGWRGTPGPCPPPVTLPAGCPGSLARAARRTWMTGCGKPQSARDSLLCFAVMMRCAGHARRSWQAWSGWGLLPDHQPSKPSTAGPAARVPRRHGTALELAQSAHKH